MHFIILDCCNYCEIMGACESLPCDHDNARSIDDLIARKELHTGDLIFFSSIGGISIEFSLFFNSKGLFSFAIKMSTFSPASHIGMVYVINKGKDKEKEYYLWHSPNRPVSDCIDIISRKPKTGPQLNDLKCALQHYSGTFMLR